MSLPTGTITFLFTDIEGSTRLLREMGDRYFSDILAQHHRLLRATFNAHHGHEIGTQGDAFFVTFLSARDAVSAAVAAQRAIASHSWPAGTIVRVRMGLHTGEPVVTETGYEGMDVHRAARICAAGHGGQILLSASTYGLVEEALPDDVGVRDLGEHQLKDLAYPLHLFQITSPHFPSKFPPLRSLEPATGHLPRPLTSFVGRERQLGDVGRLLAVKRLLSLVGAGGCGKTRLAIEAASHLVKEFDGGVWMVDLAPLSDETLVPQSIAATLNIREQPAQSWIETLVDYLQDKSLLLVLDNCEHVVNSCARQAETLLSRCPRLQILATSREPLNIAGEFVVRVPPLSLPDQRASSSVEYIASCEAVRLFVDRAALIEPEFALTALNAPLVARICHRLDGIPLAIELAAARVAIVSLKEMADRLDDRFRLLTGGFRTALPHHQTLLAAMDWSYALLSRKEQALLRQVSVFAGGWTLRATEAVCAGSGIESREVLDLLARLSDKSLVTVEHRSDEARYRQLETVRQYGRGHLEAAEEANEVRARHRDWILGVVERAEPELLGADQRTWLDQLELEHDNVRAALTNCLEMGQIETGLRIASALWRFWVARAYSSEARGWLDALLQRASAAAPQVRAKALNAAGNVAISGQIDYVTGRECFQESLSIWRALGDKLGIARALSNLGLTESNQGNQLIARSFYQESRRFYGELADEWGIALSLNNEGFAAFRHGDDLAARALLEESHAMFRKLGDRARLATVLGGLADVALRQREHRAARAFLEESLAIRRELSVKAGLAANLEGFATLAAVQGETTRAARLFGAASAARDANRTPLPAADRANYDRVVATVRTELSPAAFAAAWSSGEAMTLEQAIAEATSVGSSRA